MADHKEVMDSWCEPENWGEDCKGGGYATSRPKTPIEAKIADAFQQWADERDPVHRDDGDTHNSHDSGVDMTGRFEHTSPPPRKTAAEDTKKKSWKIPSSWEYVSELDRLSTFRHWLGLVRFNPAEAARTGFFCPRKATASWKLECFACGVKLGEWNAMNDTFYAEHKYWSPQCPMVDERLNYVYNSPAGHETRKRLLCSIYSRI